MLIFPIRLIFFNNKDGRESGNKKYNSVNGNIYHEKIINIVNQIAQQRNVSMTEVALAWLMHKGCVPIAGATKIEQLEGLIKACDLELTEEEITNLEALYVPHQLVGVMAANK